MMLLSARAASRFDDSDQAPRGLMAPCELGAAHSPVRLSNLAILAAVLAGARSGLAA
jgi:hypothetical protein